MSLTLPAEEIAEITGYKQPARQLDELLRQGFWRARRLPISGAIVLERAHYDAVCAGSDAPAKKPGQRSPQLRAA